MKEYEQKINNIINDAKQAYRNGHIDGYAEGYDHGKQDGYEDGKADTPFADTEEAEKKAYNRGLDDAWDVVRKIIEPKSDGGYSFSALLKVFDELVIQDIFKHNTATEAIAKIKAYEDKQKQDAEIKVGDEIVYSDGLKGIVVGISNTAGQISVLNNKYDVPQLLVKNRAKKTGRTFPQIAEVLAELRGAENDG